MATLTFLKVLRVLGPKDDAAWERALVGIYDALDQLGQVTGQQRSSLTAIAVTPAAAVGAVPAYLLLGDGGGDAPEAFPIQGARGDPGAPGASVLGPPGESPDVEVPPFVPPAAPASRLLTMMKWSGNYSSVDGMALPAFLNDYAGPSISGASTGAGGTWTGAGSAPYPGTTVWPQAFFYGTPAPCIVKNFRIYVVLIAGTSVTLTIYRGGSPTTVTIAASGTGTWTDLSHAETFLGDQRIDCSIQSGVGGDVGIAARVSATVEFWSVPGSGM